MSDTPLGKHQQAMLELDVHIRSNRPLIYLCTSEERRVTDAVELIASQHSARWTVIHWDIAGGVVVKDTDFIPPDQPMLDQLGVLDWYASVPAPTDGSYLVLILKDFHKFMGSDGQAGQVEHQVVRQLFNLAEEGQRLRKTILLTGTRLFLPKELEKLCAVIDWPLPDAPDIEAHLESMLAKARKREEITQQFQTEYHDDEMGALARAYQGLTVMETTFLTTYSMLTTPRLEPSRIAAAKRDIIRKSGLLEWRDVEVSLEDVGGLRELKRWLQRRERAFTEEAKAYGLPANPKGLLLVGVQGAGKSYCSEAIARFWNLPLLRLDMGRVMQGIVGSSEENIRTVIKVAESVAPCLLMIDEMDKGFSGVGSSNRSDAGTTSRVFGSFLSWMQEKEAPVYVVATANDVSQLPPELLRKGRFDEIFFVDLPSRQEREEIFRIHLKKRGRDPQNFDVPVLAAACDSFTGAEIEASIVSAMYDAFYEDREVNTGDVRRALEDTIPLAVTMAESINGLRDWAKTRARNASRMDDESMKVSRHQIAETQKTLMAPIDDDDTEL